MPDKKLTKEERAAALKDAEDRSGGILRFLGLGDPKKGRKKKRKKSRGKLLEELK